MFSAEATTSVSSAAITEPIAVSSTVQRRVEGRSSRPPSVRVQCHRWVRRGPARKLTDEFRARRASKQWMAVARRHPDPEPLEIDDEARVLALAQAGDERAFRELVEPHRRALEVHAYRMLGSPQDAEDIVQETLMRAWATLERFERRASIGPGSTGSPRTPAWTSSSGGRARPEPVVPVSGRAPARGRRPRSSIPAARYAMREGIELAFLTAIQRLPGRQRAILILRDVLGWTSGEVAELLESTVAAVNSGLQRARATIDAELPAESPTAAAPSQRELLYAYVDAWERADIDGLVALLREDAVIRMPPQPRSSATARSRSSSPGPRRATPARRSPPPRPRGPTAGWRS